MGDLLVQPKQVNSAQPKITKIEPYQHVNSINYIATPGTTNYVQWTADLSEAWHYNLGSLNTVTSTNENNFIDTVLPNKNASTGFYRIQQSDGFNAKLEDSNQGFITSPEAGSQRWSVASGINLAGDTIFTNGAPPELADKPVLQVISYLSHQTAGTAYWLDRENGDIYTQNYDMVNGLSAVKKVPLQNTASENEQYNSLLNQMIFKTELSWFNGQETKPFYESTTLKNAFEYLNSVQGQLIDQGKLAYN